jgi:PRTRC genetic system protein C
MTKAIITLKRVFIINSLKISDPAPTLPLDSVTRLLAQQYPQFRWTTLLEEDGRIVGNELQFSLVLPPPKTNG